MRNRSFRIGTRGSQLAIWQAEKVKSLILENFPDIDVAISVIHTQGDRILDVSLSKIGDKGLFTKDIETALSKNEVDMAVHSLKDLPTAFPAGLRLGAVLERAEVRDAFVSYDGRMLGEMGAGDVVATSSLRRRSQLLALNAGFEVIDIRGNIDTRVAKMDKGYCDGIVMAAAGLQRLGLGYRITGILDETVMYPAVSQGAIAIEIRENDAATEEILAPVNHPETMLITTAERAFLRSMEGGCQIPVGGFSSVHDGEYTFTGFLASLDGLRTIKVTRTGRLEDAEAVTLAVSDEMKAEGALDILAEIRNF